MLKIAKESAIEEQPEFFMANEFLKKSVTHIASTHSKDNVKQESKEIQLERHFKLVASLAKNYLYILEILDKDLLETFKNKKGNILSINKFLALRQLTETQLKGLTQGTWDIESKGISSDTFQQVAAESDIILKRKDIVEFLTNTDIDIKDISNS